MTHREQLQKIRNHGAGLQGYRFGGDSSSSSSTRSIDQRVITESGTGMSLSENSAGAIARDNAQAVTVSGTNAAVTLTDRGAVSDAFGFANSVARDAYNMATASQVDATRTISDALEKVEEAYADAKQGEQKILTAAGLAVVAVVALAAVKRT